MTYIFLGRSFLEATLTDSSKEKALTFNQHLFVLKSNIKKELQCVLWSFNMVSDSPLHIPPLYEWSCTYPTIFGFNIIHTPNYVLFDGEKIKSIRGKKIKYFAGVNFKPPLFLSVVTYEEEFFHRLKKAGILKPQEDKTTLPKTLRRRIPRPIEELD